MFSGMKAVPANKLNEEVFLKVAIIGEPKTGKSRFAATAPKPIQVYDFDRRAVSLAGQSGVFVTTLFDKSQDKPSAMIDLEGELSMWQMKKAKGEPIPATFVLDSLTFMREYMENECMRQDNSLARIVKVGPSNRVKIGANWDIVNAVTRYLKYWITEFTALGNLILVCHERAEKDKALSTPTITKYTGRITIDPQYLSGILSTFNEVFRITVNQQGKYTVDCKPNDEILASTTLLLDAEEPPDIMAMLKKHRERKQAKASQPVK